MAMCAPSACRSSKAQGAGRGEHTCFTCYHPSRPPNLGFGHAWQNAREWLGAVAGCGRRGGCSCCADALRDPAPPLCRPLHHQVWLLSGFRRRLASTCDNVLCRCSGLDRRTPAPLSLPFCAPRSQAACSPCHRAKPCSLRRPACNAQAASDDPAGCDPHAPPAQTHTHSLQRPGCIRRV